MKIEHGTRHLSFTIALLVCACVPTACNRHSPTASIQSPDHEVRNRAITSFSRRATSSDIDDLCSLLLRHASARVRADCARALGNTKAASAVPALIRALEDEHWLVRRSSVKALDLIGDARAMAPLIRTLSDREPEVQKYAAWALRHFHCPEAVPLLVSKLRFANPTNLAAIDDMNQAVLVTLAAQADRRSLPSAVRMLDDPHSGRYAADAVGAIIGKEFKEEVAISDGMTVLLGSPTKAKEWLRGNPGILRAASGDLGADNPRVQTDAASEGDAGAEAKE